MNGKKAKAIRKAVKGMMPIPQETIYNDYHPPVYANVPDKKGIVNTVKVKRGVPRVMGACLKSACKRLKQPY